MDFRTPLSLVFRCNSANSTLLISLLASRFAGMADLGQQAPPAVQRVRMGATRVCSSAFTGQPGWIQALQAARRSLGRGVQGRFLLFSCALAFLLATSPADFFRFQSHRLKATSPLPSSTLSASWAGPAPKPPPAHRHPHPHATMTPPPLSSPPPPTLNHTNRSTMPK